ncbi:Protein kinase domain protein [Cryptosporidium meleagridis]|uniref:Protein kinase domain protein n=1 Tax=Cryptosporidium meleagridis TaxID=93969 RepID=A0A2P4YYR2_9CRYT|nr:Protein kinase domain protein [Cryptosporidium meleagridis]
MEVKSSGIFEEILIKSELSSKKASKVCIAEGFTKSGEKTNLILLKMYRKDMVVNHNHIWNERNVLEYIRDCKTMTEDEKLALPLINIIIESETERVKLIDMSLACFVDTKKQRLSEFCGTFHAMAPEMICMQKPNYSMEYDWWSFGVIIYEMVFGIPPYGYHPEVNKYLLKRINESPKSLSFPEPVVFMGDFALSRKNREDTQDLIMQLLNKDESIRLGSDGDFKQVIGHPWFKSCH